MNINYLKKTVYLRLFLYYTVVIFIILGSVLYVFNLFPDELGSSQIAKTDSQIVKAEEVAIVKEILASRIVIASVNIDTVISNPQSQDVSVLDQALLSGAVYYPGSGSLLTGNMFVFGHSTGLSVVRNQAFKAFNNLKNVKEGDEINVYGNDGNVYVYKAISTELVNDDSALVEFDTTERMITLSTCNTFGKKEERHVVKAVFSHVK